VFHTDAVHWSVCVSVCERVFVCAWKSVYGYVYLCMDMCVGSGDAECFIPIRFIRVCA